MKRGLQPNIMDALYEFHICSLISQAVIKSLWSVRQCANTPRTEKKASRHQQEGMCIQADTGITNKTECAQHYKTVRCMKGAHIGFL